MTKSTASFLAFASGILTGAALGLLFAPDEGSNTRNKLSYKLSKYSGDLKELIDKLIEHEILDSNSAKEEGQKVIKDTKEQAEKLLDDVESLIGQIKGSKN